MNLLITIFGGMLLAALLYGVARLIRLSNFWASIVAAGLPSAAYLFYAFSHWSGLDVVTMHVVAYPTVALLFYLLYESKPGKDLNVHWVPRLLIGFFVVLTVVLGGFVYVAVNGLPAMLAERLLPNARGKLLHTGFAGVVEHGDEAAKSINQHRDTDARLARLGWNVEVAGLDALASDHSSEVSVLLRKSDGGGVTGQVLRFSLSRPGQSTQVGEAMHEAGSGDYRISSVLPAAGVWLATISFSAEGKTIALQHPVGHE